MKQFVSTTEVLIEGWKKVYSFILKGDPLYAMFRLEQISYLAPNKPIYFRNSLVTTDDNVLKIMGSDRIGDLNYPYIYKLPLTQWTIAKDLDLARAQVTEHMYKQLMQRPVQQEFQDNCIPYIQEELNPVGHIPSAKYPDVLGISESSNGKLSIILGEVKNKAHSKEIFHWYQTLDLINESFAKVSDPLSLFLKKTNFFSLAAKKGFNLKNVFNEDVESSNIILYKHISLAVNSDQYCQLRESLGDPIIRKEVLDFMEKIKVGRIDVQLWNIIPSWQEISPLVKLKYQYFLENGKLLI